MLVDVFGVWRFRELPKLVASFKEWVNPHPVYGVSLFTAEYYSHIWASLFRVLSAFISATLLGIAVGVFMGWSRIFYGLTFPLLEILRPIPILAWIPLAILLLPGRELPIIGLTFLAAFFVTILNTLLGVKSIDEVYFRAARSLGFSDTAILWHIIIPGAMPYIFIGLQIAMGACWFSLVASEIVSGQAGTWLQSLGDLLLRSVRNYGHRHGDTRFARISLECHRSPHRQSADALAGPHFGGGINGRTVPRGFADNSSRRQNLRPGGLARGRVARCLI